MLDLYSYVGVLMSVDVQEREIRNGTKVWRSITNYGKYLFFYLISQVDWKFINLLILITNF